jgi:hypothetical protein
MRTLLLLLMQPVYHSFIYLQALATDRSWQLHKHCSVHLLQATSTYRCTCTTAYVVSVRNYYCTASATCRTFWRVRKRQFDHTSSKRDWKLLQYRRYESDSKAAKWPHWHPLHNAWLQHCACLYSTALYERYKNITTVTKATVTRVTVSHTPVCGR